LLMVLTQKRVATLEDVRGAERRLDLASEVAYEQEDRENDTRFGGTRQDAQSQGTPVTMSSSRGYLLTRHREHPHALPHMQCRTT